MGKTSFWGELVNGGSGDNCSPIGCRYVDDESDVQWDESADLLIVGFGAAGVAAAIKAREQGQEVLALDRFIGGGATAISGGIFYAGGGTNIQKAAGVKDDPENMFNYLRQEVKGAVTDETLRDFCNESVPTLDWLQKHGVPFSPKECPYKTSYPSNLYYLYYSGNESFKPWTDKAYPAPRGHRAHGPGVSGAKLFWPLYASALKMGVRLLTQARVDKLIMTKSGRVLGVQFRHLEGGISAFICKLLFKLLVLLRYAVVFVPPISTVFRQLINAIHAKYSVVKTARGINGVVMAAGGFFFNRDMLAKYASPYIAGTPLGTLGDDGAGIRMAQGVGASLGYMHRVSAWRFMNPPGAFIKGCIVNKKGERMCNEMLYGAQLSEIMCEKNQGKAYIIIDASIWTEALKELKPSRCLWFHAAAALLYLFLERGKAKSIRELADVYDIPADTLEKTIANYNELARNNGENDPLGKLPGYHRELTKGPFYALDASYDTFFVPCPALTTGGVRVSEQSGLVLRDDGSEIEGLYAAGRAAVGIASQSYVSGLSIADCVYAGRRAADHSVKFKGQVGCGAAPH